MIAMVGYVLGCVILVKLIMIGKNLNFLNIMFINLFVVEIVCGIFIIPNFFEIGQKNWNNNQPDPESLMEACGIW